MLNFIVNLHISIDELRNGGLMVLHKLSYDLADMGNMVYIFTKPHYPHPNIKQIPSIRKYPSILNNNAEYYHYNIPANLDLDNTISIYPEIQSGNPYKTKNNVRWILYNTNPHIEKSWNSSDIYFNFRSFKTNRKCDGVLTTADYNFDVLYDMNLSRSGYCYILHKTTPPNYMDVVKKFSAVNLTGWQKHGYDYLRSELNKYEYLILFDHNTFNATASILCGTKVINITSDGDMTPEEYYKSHPKQSYGVAHGLSQIHHADSTILMARDNVIKIANTENETIIDFVNFWKSKLKNLDNTK